MSILKILKEFKTNNATGVDNIPWMFFKDSSNILCTHVAKIYNLSINLPLSQTNEVTKIKPLYKKGLKTDPKNFRTILLLPLISKTIE